jgi:RNA polymerase sigma-70 factor, ECF subfamily
MELSDDVLVRACLAGNRDAFTALMERHVRQVYAIAYSERLSETDAADVAQESFTRAYERPSQLRRPDRFGAWIARIAYHQAKDYRRLRRTEIPMNAVHMLEDHPAADIIRRFESAEDARKLISKGLAALPRDLRDPLTMHYMGGMSHSDIAELLATSVPSIDMRVSRARRRLGDWFRRNGLEGECAEVLRTYGSSWPLSALVIDPALNRVQQAPVPSQASAGRYFGSLVVSSVCVAGILTGIAAAHVRAVTWADLRLDGTFQPADTVSVQVADVGAYSAHGQPGHVRQLIRPADELRGWIPQERDKDSTLPRSAGGLGSALTATFANDFGA